MSLPGKGWEGHICSSLVKDGKDIYVSPWLRMGRAYMSLPGKGWEGHICSPSMTSC